jgi:hypothetical protein
MLLFQAYEGVGEFDKAVDLLQRIERTYGTMGGVKEFVEAKKAEIEALKKSQKAVTDTSLPRQTNPK